jgi:hypothetical protein
MIKKSLIIVAVLFFVSGCASHYFLDGKKYDDEEVFQTAVEAKRQVALDSIQPLSAPLTKKRLIVAIPSEQTIFAENSRRHQASTGQELRGVGIDQNRNLSKANFKMNKIWFEAIQKKKIFSSVEIRETDTPVNSLEPSPEYDVMYFSEPAIGAGQYFYSSTKHGKQVFAYDQSQPGTTARVASFIAAVQALAVRE